MDYLSLAYLNAWEYCPRRFYLEYVLDENTVQRTITYGTPQPEQPGSIII